MELKKYSFYFVFLFLFLCACLPVNAYDKNHHETALKTPVQKSGQSFLHIHIQAHFRVRKNVFFFFAVKSKAGPVMSWEAGWDGGGGSCLKIPVLAAVRNDRWCLSRG